MCVQLIFEFDFLSQVNYTAFQELLLPDNSWSKYQHSQVTLIVGFLFIALLDNGVCKRKIKSTTDRITGYG